MFFIYKVMSHKINQNFVNNLTTKGHSSILVVHDEDLNNLKL